MVVEQALTPERWEAYLQGIRQTGLKRASARAASPHASPKTGAYSTFITAERNDPVKRAEVEEAMAEFNERLQAEVVRRAVEGLPEKLFQAGKLMRDENGQPVVVRRYCGQIAWSDLLEARMPTHLDAWEGDQGRLARSRTPTRTRKALFLVLKTFVHSPLPIARRWRSLLAQGLS